MKILAVIFFGQAKEHTNQFLKDFYKRSKFAENIQCTPCALNCLPVSSKKIYIGQPMNILWCMYLSHVHRKSFFKCVQ